MKIHCQLCKEIVAIGAFRITGDAIEITCEACGGAFRVTSDGEVTELGARAGRDAAQRPPAEARGPAPEPGGEMECPKCDRSQPEGDACRYCGLRAELFAKFAEDADDAPGPLAALWEQCRASWSSDEAHDRFRDAVAAASAYRYGARCYRRALRERPDDAIARRCLERMGRMAEAALFARATARQAVDEERTPYRNVVLLLLVILMVAAAAGVYAVTSMLRKQGDEGVPAPVKIETSPGHTR